MSELGHYRRLQFTTQGLLLTVAWLGAFVASAAAVRSVAPLWLFVPLMMTQVIHISASMRFAGGIVRRACVRGLVIGAAVALLLYLLGGKHALSNLLPFWTKNHPLEPFVQSPIGLVLTGVGFSLMCGIIDGSVSLFIARKPVAGTLSLLLVLVWLFLVSLGVLTRHPTFRRATAAASHQQLCLLATAPRRIVRYNRCGDEHAMVDLDRKELARVGFQHGMAGL